MSAPNPFARPSAPPTAKPAQTAIPKASRALPKPKDVKMVMPGASLALPSKAASSRQASVVPKTSASLPLPISKLKSVQKSAGSLPGMSRNPFPTLVATAVSKKSAPPGSLPGVPLKAGLPLPKNLAMKTMNSAALSVPTTKQQVPTNVPTTKRLADPNTTSNGDEPPSDEFTHRKVSQTVRDVGALLQSYGPLTLGQMAYNLPPHDRLGEIVQILVRLGMVQQVKGEEVRYCIGKGVPRPYELTVLWPHAVQRDIAYAHRAANDSFERSKVLRAALQDPSKDVKVVLEGLLKKYPDISNDPVYVAALRNCHANLEGTRSRNGKRPLGAMSSKGGS